VVGRDQPKAGGSGLDHRLVPALAVGEADVVRGGRVEAGHLVVGEGRVDDMERCRVGEPFPNLCLKSVKGAIPLLLPPWRIEAELEHQDGVVLASGRSEPGAQQSLVVLARAHLGDVQESRSKP